MLEYILVFLALAVALSAFVCFSAGARRAAESTGEMMGADAP